jgi:ubiquinone/menaquinone biosynthesis C-methylase UbiE
MAKENKKSKTAAVASEKPVAPRILNVGCGNQYYGTDRIDIIKTEATKKVCNIEKRLPFPDNTFDEVYSQYVFEHMKNPYNLLLEMKRVCKVGGKIIVITDNAAYIFFHIKWRGRDYHGNYSDQAVHGDNFNKLDKHYLLYTPEHLRNFFETANLKVEQIGFKYWETVTSTKSKVFHKTLKMILGERFTKPSVIVVGRKV